MSLWKLEKLKNIEEINRPYAFSFVALSSKKALIGDYIEYSSILPTTVH